MRHADEQVGLTVHLALLPYVNGSVVSASYRAETCQGGREGAVRRGETKSALS